MTSSSSSGSGVGVGRFGFFVRLRLNVCWLKFLFGLWVNVIGAFVYGGATVFAGFMWYFFAVMSIFVGVDFLSLVCVSLCTVGLLFSCWCMAQYIFKSVEQYVLGVPPFNHKAGV